MKKNNVVSKTKEVKETKKEEKYLLYDTNEKPPIGKWIFLAIQHVFAMFGATILVPILVNAAAGAEVLTIPVALVASGIGTLIYILCTKGKSPVYLGSSFAFITPVAVAYMKGGTSGFVTGIVGVGVIYIIFALLIKLFGKKWIDKLLPTIVIGPMIMIIGLGLAPSAVSQVGLTSSSMEANVEYVCKEGYDLQETNCVKGKEVVEAEVKYSCAEGYHLNDTTCNSDFPWKNVLVAAVAFLVTGIVAIAGKGFSKIIPFLIGIVSGYVMAVILGMVDFTPVKEAGFFSLPKFLVIGKDYVFSWSGLLTIAPIALVTIAEHIGDHMALSTIIRKDLLKKPGLERTLLGDGLATAVAGLIGGPANTTYGENTSVVGMTKVGSVWVIGLAAIIAICLFFLGKLTALISTIPGAVLGGVSLLLYGFIAVNGLRALVDNRVDFGNTRNVIIASTMLVLGLGGAVVSLTIGNASVAFTGMSLAAIIGIILNLVLPGKDIPVYKKDEK